MTEICCNELFNENSCTRPFVDGENRLLGTSQVSVLTEASHEKKGKVVLKAGDAGKLPTEVVLHQEMWKQGPSWPEN